MKKLLTILCFIPLVCQSQIIYDNGKYNLLLYKNHSRFIDLDEYYHRPTAAMIDKFSVWIDLNHEKATYYKDSIGVQDRNALTQNSVTGVVKIGNSVMWDSDKSQYSTTSGLDAPANFKIATNSLTFSTWFKISGVDATQYTFLFGFPNSLSGYYYCITQNNTGKLQFIYRDSGGDIVYTGTSNVCDNTWHHVFVVMDKTGNLSMYIDNVLQGSPVSLSGKAFSSITFPFYMGMFSAASYYGKLQMRDFRLFSSAITSDSLRTEIYNQNYVAGMTSWWLMEDGNYGLTKKINDCVGINHLVNLAFDGTSDVKGVWTSMYNKYGYSNITYQGADVFQGDGNFTDMTKWSYTASRWSTTGDGIEWLATDDLSPRMRNLRVINYTIGDVFIMEFDVLSGNAYFSLQTYPGAGVIHPAATYAVGHHSVVFRIVGYSDDDIQLFTTAASGAWAIDNLTIKPYDLYPLPPLMTSTNPATDIHDSTLIFRYTAKNNLFKGTGDTVYFSDSIAEVFNACELIITNDWFNATGVHNNVNWADISYQSGRQYIGENELIIIKAGSTLTEAEDTRLRQYLNIPLVYAPYNPLDVSIGTTSGTTAQIYTSQKAIRDAGAVSSVVFMNPVSQELDPTDNYIAVGWADWFENDYLYTAPMARKYGFSNSFYRQIVPLSYDPLNTKKYIRSKLKQIEQGGSYDANHAPFHFSSLSNYPLADGRTIPSNYNIRHERADGTNAFGHDVDATVDASVTAVIRSAWLRLSGATGAKAWKNLTDADCDSIRKMLSVYGAYYDPQNSEMFLQSLDILSNRYCGTTGYSVQNGNYATRVPNTAGGVSPDASHRILGGIFQGAATTQNHEIWERILIINDLYKREFEGKTRTDLFWATPAGTLYLHYKPEDWTSSMGSFKDSLCTKILSGGSNFTSSITNTSRNFYECLGNYGYITMMSAQGDGYGSSLDGCSLLEAARIYKKNGIKKPTNLGDGYSNAMRLWDPTIPQADQNSLFDSTDMVKALYNYTFTNGRYTGLEPIGGTPPYYKIIDYIARYNAWGLTPDFVADAGCSGDDRSSYLLVLEGVYQYCKRAGIKVISHEEAELLGRNYTMPSAYNYWPNNTFAKTPRTITASNNAPLYPDGWNGGTVAADTSLYYNSAGTIFTRQYALPAYGTFNYSFKGKGDAYLYIKKIRNNDTLFTTSGANFDIINTIHISSPSTYTTYSGVITIPNVALETYGAPATPKEEAYQEYMQRYGNKICGIQIELVVTGANTVNIKQPTIYEQ